MPPAIGMSSERVFRAGTHFCRACRAGRSGPAVSMLRRAGRAFAKSNEMKKLSTSPRLLSPI